METITSLSTFVMLLKKCISVVKVYKKKKIRKTENEVVQPKKNWSVIFFHSFDLILMGADSAYVPFENLI